MLPKTHPIAKTATDLRRAIHRLENFRSTNPKDEYIEKVYELIRDLESARSHIPNQFMDTDLQGE